MALLGIKFVPYFHGRSKTVKKIGKRIVFTCDYCGDIYECQYSIDRKKRKGNYCSKRCHDLRQKENRANMGRKELLVWKDKVSVGTKLGQAKMTENDKNRMYFNISIAHQNRTPREKEQTLEKTRKTNMKKYNVEHVFQSIHFKKENKKTLMARHGVSHNLKIESALLKREETWMKKYGVDNPLKNDSVQRKRIETLNNNFGVNSPFESIEIRQSAKNTMFDRYGYENPFKEEAIRDSWDRFDMAIKAHETKKHNGSYGKSQIEDFHYKVLCLTYNNVNIERQKPTNSWSIDFYFPGDDTYRDFHGAYFHGKNETHDSLIEKAIIYESKTGKSKSQYRTIANTIIRDELKQQYFSDNNINYEVIWEDDFLSGIKKIFGHKNFKKITNDDIMNNIEELKALDMEIVNGYKEQRR